MEGGDAVSSRPGQAIVVVVDASTLIALERIGRLDILERLFASVLIPPAVAREVGSDLARLSWIEVRRLAQPIDRRIVGAELGAGKREAIGLAFELGPYRVILDDLAARKLAESLGLPVIGVLGLLVTAKVQLVLPELRPVIEALLAAGFRLSPDLVRSTLATVGERVDR
jgi:predicted nucleic acid-binding protein